MSEDTVPYGTGNALAPKELALGPDEIELAVQALELYDATLSERIGAAAGDPAMQDALRQQARRVLALRDRLREAAG